uniref:Uncharacterized protein n=1 Tax=Sphaerodactylus townsendi TaxID=933632 RepID=A0ACB8EIY8_9SAUR
MSNLLSILKVVLNWCFPHVPQTQRKPQTSKIPFFPCSSAVQGERKANPADRQAHAPFFHIPSLPLSSQMAKENQQFLSADHSMKKAKHNSFLNGSVCLRLHTLPTAPAATPSTPPS